MYVKKLILHLMPGFHHLPNNDLVYCIKKKLVFYNKPITSHSFIQVNHSLQQEMTIIISIR